MYCTENSVPEEGKLRVFVIKQEPLPLIVEILILVQNVRLMLVSLEIGVVEQTRTAASLKDGKCDETAEYTILVISK